MAEGHNVRRSSWITVGLIVLGFVLLGIALPAQSIVLGVIGAVVLVAGFIMGGVTRIMDDAY